MSDSQSTENIALYDRWFSSCCARVRASLIWHQIPYESISVDFGAHPEWYKAINPAGSVPALKVGEKGLITQSMAILEYIEEVWGGHGRGSLLPVDPMERAAVRMFCEVIVSDVQPRHNPRITAKMEEKEAGSGAAWARECHTQGFAILEAFLASSPFHVPPSSSSTCFSIGNRLSLADLCLVPMLENALSFGMDKQELMDEYKRIGAIWRYLEGKGDEVQEVMRLASWRNQPDTPEEVKDLPAKRLRK